MVEPGLLLVDCIDDLVEGFESRGNEFRRRLAGS